MNEWDEVSVLDEPTPPQEDWDSVSAPQSSWDDVSVGEADPVQDTGQSRLSSGTNEALKSFAKVGTGTLSGLSELPGFFARNLNPIGWAAKAGFEPAQKAVEAYSGAIDWMKGAAEGGEQLLEENLPTNPKFQEEWISSKIPSVIGQAAGQLGTALIPAKWLQLGSKGVQALGLSQAGLLGLESGYKEADRLGVQDPVKRDILATITAGTEAGTEAFGGLGGKSFSKALAGEIRDLLDGTALKTIVKTAAGEGLEEVAAKIPQDIASTVLAENEAPIDTINPLKTEYWGNLAEAWGLGAIAGGLFGGAQALENRKTASNALAMRASVQDHEADLTARRASGETLTPEEEEDLIGLKSYDSRLSAWLESQGMDQTQQQAGLATAKAISSATRAGMPETAEALRLAAKAATDRKIAALQQTLDKQEGVTAEPAQTVAPIEPIAPTPDATIQPTQIVPPAQELESQDSAPPLEPADPALSVPAAEPELTVPIEQRVEQEFRARGAEPALQAILPAIQRWGKAFSGVQFQDLGGTTGAVTPDGQLLLDPKFIAESLASGSITPESIETVLQEEVIHPAVDRATARMMEAEMGRPVTLEEVQQRHATDWTSLPENVRKESERLYRIAAIERGRRDLKKQTLTDEEIDAILARTPLSDVTRGIEFKRQVIQGRLFGVLTEEAQANPGFAKWLRNFLNELLAAIRDVAARLTDPSARKRLDDLEQEVRAELAKLGVETGPSSEAAPPSKPQDGAPTSSVSNAPEVVTPDQDQAYLKAVESGDMDSARAMVEQAANGAGYDIDAFHGTIADDITEFSTAARKRMGRIWGDGVYLTESRKDAEQWAEKASRKSGWGQGHVMPLKLRLRKPLVLDGEGSVANMAEMLPPEFARDVMPLLRRDEETELASIIRGETFLESFEWEKPAKQIAEYARELGYDGIVGSYENVQHYVAFDPTQIKSAETVTRDAQGNIIPPSKRFNPQSADIRYASEPVPTPQQELSSILDRWRRRASPTHEEGMDPAKATSDERTYKKSGEKVEQYRPSISNAELNQDGRSMLKLSAQMSGDRFNKTFGQKVLAFIEDRGDLQGIPRDDLVQAWMARAILNNSKGLASDLRLDPRQAEGPFQSALSRMGTGLQLASFGQVYDPLKDLRENAKEVVDKGLKKEGISDDISFAKDITDPVTKVRQDQVEDVAKLVMHEFDAALPAFDERRQEILKKLFSNLKRISEIRQQMSAMSAPEVVGAPEAITRESLQAELDRLVEESNDLIAEFHGTPKRKRKAKPKAEEAEAEIKAAVEAAEEVAKQASFTEWVKGADQEGIPKFVDLMTENINPAGFNREAFMEALIQKFENVDPDLIEDVTNRVGDALDAKTEVAEEEETPDFDARVKRIVGLSVAGDSSPAVEKAIDPMTAAVKKRLKGEMTAQQFMEELSKLDIEPQTAFALNRKVELDIQRQKARALERQNAAERKRELERSTKEVDSMSRILEKELNDIQEKQGKKVLSDVQDLVAEFMGERGPSISEEQFLERMQALNVPDAKAQHFLKLVIENRRRTWLAAVTKLRQKEEAMAQKEKDRVTAQGEAKIAALAKEFSDVLMPEEKKALTGLKKLIEDYSGKNGPPISDEMFLEEAAKLGVAEGTLNRLLSILQESRRRDYLVAITKLDQADKAKLKKEQEGRDREANNEINRMVDSMLGPKAKKPDSEYRKAVDAFRAFELDEAGLRSALSAIDISPEVQDRLLKHLKNERDIIGWERSKMIRENVQKARTAAIDRAVKAMTAPKVKDAPKRSRFVKALTEAAEAGVLDSNAVRDAFAEAYDLHGLTQDRMEKLADILRRIEAMPDGADKETLLEMAYNVLNDIAPNSKLVDALYQNLLGGVLSGAGTIVSQFSRLSAVLNPFQNTYQFMTLAGGKPMRNPATFARVWGQYLKQIWSTSGTVPVGMKGVAGGQTYGLGVSPSDLAAFKPHAMSLARLKPSELYKFRVGRADWVKSVLGFEPTTQFGRRLKNTLLFPSWMASRSFALIRGAEAWTGSIDRNMTARALMMKALVDKGSSVSEAYQKVSDAFNPQTNKAMWDEALARADADIKAGLVAKGLRKQRAEELMQDRLDEEFQSNLKNRHRQLSAWLNFKDDPITPVGSWFAKDVMGKAPTLVKSVFLFSRFFSNIAERAIFNSPLGFIHMSKATAEKGAQTALQKRIEAMFGSLENYRQYRNGLASSSLVSTFTMSTAIALAWAFWKWGDDDDEGKPPVFWITGATPPSTPYATGRQLAAAGWWQPSSIVINLPWMEKPILLNYVQANPELAITLNAIGNVADRIMFPEMLNYTVDARTGERQFSPFKATVQPFVNALMSPATRSTYVTTQQAIERMLSGDPKGMAKLLSRPGGEMLAATVLGGPGVRDIRKAAMPETPKASQNWKQALASGIPFADVVGLDTGSEMLNAWGEGISPFSHFPFFNEAQESSDAVKSASKILNDSGITKEGPQEWMIEPDLFEIALNGERVLLDPDERREVLGDIGFRFARAINEDERKIRSATEFKEKQKIVQGLLRESRAQVLRQWRSKIKRED